MTEISPSRRGSHRVADVQLRGPAPRATARVHWPAAAGTAAAPLVVLFVAADDQWADRLVERVGAVVLAVTAAHPIEAHAALAWAADHAAELGAEPDRLAVAGIGSGAALAERVAELAADEGWPPLRDVALIWPHDDPTDAVDRLAAALARTSSGTNR